MEYVIDCNDFDTLKEFVKEILLFKTKDEILTEAHGKDVFTFPDVTMMQYRDEINNLERIIE